MMGFAARTVAAAVENCGIIYKDNLGSRAKDMNR